MLHYWDYFSYLTFFPKGINCYKYSKCQLLIQLYINNRFASFFSPLNQSVNQSSLLSYMRHGCPVARARGSCLECKTIKLSRSKSIWNKLKEIESNWTIKITKILGQGKN